MRRSWPVMLALGMLGTTFCNLASYTGLKYTTAVSGSILNSFVPVIIIAISWAFLGQRLRASQWAGVAALKGPQDATIDSKLLLGF